MEIVLAWIVFSCVNAAIAETNGRSAGKWLLSSIILSPLICFVVLLLLGKSDEAIKAKEVEDGASKICPHCAEIVKAAAKVCKHCNRDL